MLCLVCINIISYVLYLVYINIIQRTLGDSEALDGFARVYVIRGSEAGGLICTPDMYALYVYLQRTLGDSEALDGFARV